MSIDMSVYAQHQLRRVERMRPRAGTTTAAGVLGYVTALLCGLAAALLWLMRDIIDSTLASGRTTLDDGAGTTVVLFDGLAEFVGLMAVVFLVLGIGYAVLSWLLLARRPAGWYGLLALSVLATVGSVADGTFDIGVLLPIAVVACLLSPSCRHDLHISTPNPGPADPTSPTDPTNGIALHPYEETARPDLAPSRPAPPPVPPARDAIWDESLGAYIRFEGTAVLRHDPGSRRWIAV